MNDDLLRFRAQFPILQRLTYLVSHSLGAMPLSVHERLKEYADTWESKGVAAWSEGWWDLPVRTGDEIARLISAPSGSISMHPNITLSQAVILSCFEDDHFRNGRRSVVTESLNFPSILYLLDRWSEGRDIRVKIVPSDDGTTVDTGRMLAAIDDDTFLVTISHVLFRSGYIQDVPAIVRRARDVGAYVLLDAFQSVGTLPVDVGSLDVDFLVGGVLKWLCGGPGGCFMYVRPEILPLLRPRLTGWFAHADPFAFDTGPMRYRTDAFRMLNGTPSIPGLYAATAGVEIVRQAGVGNIRRKSLRQTGILIAAARREGWAVNSPIEDERRGGAVTLDVPHALEVSRALINRDIIVDFRRGGGIRIAPHFYNTDDEVRASVDAMIDILSTDAWKQFAAKEDFIT